MKSNISVILTQYKRPHLHKLQVEAIRSQSVKPAEIFCWVNSCNRSFIRVEGVSYILCEANWKFHGRFALSMLCQTKYVAIFDDDIIPGPKWFESCLDYVEYGILGSSGIRLPRSGYRPHVKVGHNGTHSTCLEKVNLVGHSWFSNKQFLRNIWREEPLSWDNGEDIQLAALSQIHSGVGCYVPPHPENDTSVWGCLPEYRLLGDDRVATSKVDKSHYCLRSKLVEEYKKKGWKI